MVIIKGRLARGECRLPVIYTAITALAGKAIAMVLAGIDEKNDCY